MQSSQHSLPQLSSYLPQISGVRGSESTIDNDANGRIPDPHRRNSSENASPTFGSQSFMGKRKQAPTSAAMAYANEQRVAVPIYRQTRAQEQQAISRTSSSEDGSTPTTDAADSTAPRRERTSRYLSDNDRREIIMRIDNGEKQVTLAREFSVSRAAICNLYKNREEVLARFKKSRSADTSPSHAPRTASSVQPTAPVPTLSYPDVATMSIHSESPDGGPATADSVKEIKMLPARTGIQVGVPPQDVQYPAYGQRTRLEDLYRHQQNEHFEEKGGRYEPPRPFMVHDASVYSRPCKNLINSLRDENISAAEYQQRAARLARLLIEETLTCLPQEDVEVKNQYGDICRATKSLDERDICAISMEDNAKTLLHAFSDISPASPTGIISIGAANRNESTPGNLTSPRIQIQLPAILPHQAILLLDAQCSTGAEACAVLNYLVHDKRIPVGNIYFVTVASTLEGLQTVFQHFPDVKLITANMDMSSQQQLLSEDGNSVHSNASAASFI
ncbi:hypothetical protein PHYBOEH_007901 [Phytophthora boehmeriae]|uniref:Phosphoribosyltransferase domain-containing protein n=1 Tax=Phytophthora boehmeriae TaxID=109152 RepID=A0A8T1W9D1_9STRA|nr:hypothetical protein PHYBOEH_007901 [Phytophthora boehmeriae]